MKKTFPVNINGTVFYIDEDAYNLLKTYLEQLRQTFPGTEGKEIVDDIEARISEHFSEIIMPGTNVVTLRDVSEVIEMMGRPQDFAEDESEHETSDSARNKAEEPTTVPPPFPEAQHKKLYRDVYNRVFGGVLSGLACFFGWNRNILRLLVVILALFTHLWPVILAYLICWMVIPAAVTPRQILEMQGTPVTVGNVGQTIMGTADPTFNRMNGEGFWKAFGNAVLIFIGVVSGLIALSALSLFISAVWGGIMYWGWDNLSFLNRLDIPYHINANLTILAIIAMSFAIVIPSLGVTWALFSTVFKLHPISKPILVTGIILEALLIVATVVMMLFAGVDMITYLSFRVDPVSAVAGTAAAFPAMIIH